MNKYISLILSLILVLTMVFFPMEKNTAHASGSSYEKTWKKTVQSYEKQKGTFTLNQKSRLYIVSQKKPAGILLSTVNLMDSEFAAKGFPSEKPMEISYGKEKRAKAGDIVLKIEKGHATQGYTMTIGKKTVIAASDADGIMNGLRALLKYHIAKDSRKLSGAVIKDWPDVKERVVHLDCARKYFPKAWVKNFIKKSSWQGYNAIEIHFSEDQGLRLESKKYPWLAGSYNGSKGTYSQKDMAEIIKVAKKYHMQVIPSFDSPGHLNYMTKRYAEYVASHPDFKFTYNGKTYSKKNKGFRNISSYFMHNGDRTEYTYIGIDLSNPVARAFTKSLIDEYARFFQKHGAKAFNIGGDELLGWSNVTVGGRTFTYSTKWQALQHWEKYARKTLKIKNGSAMDTFVSYMNDTNKRLSKMGYTCRMWSDEVYRTGNQHVKLSRNIQIVYWSNNYAPLSSLVKKGFQVYNANSLRTYFVSMPNFSGAYPNVNGQDIYNMFNPKNFANPGKDAQYVPKKQYKGAYFCIWCDYATHQSSSGIWQDVNRKMWASSAKMWNMSIHRDGLKYSSFKAYTKKIGGFPGYSGKSTKASKLPKSAKLTHTVI